MDEHVSLYVSPINIDPEKPAMPISHPSYYSTYLSKKIGPFATLGLAEDTWALNEKVTDDATFWTQTYDIDAEREQMLHAALDRLRKGALVIVFDATDRIHHMFWRYLEEGHPAAAGRRRPRVRARHRGALPAQRRGGRARARPSRRRRPADGAVRPRVHLVPARRQPQRLAARARLPHPQGGSRRRARSGCATVDWSQTRAYAVGLIGMFLNIRGREADGIVEPGAEAER